MHTSGHAQMSITLSMETLHLLTEPQPKLLLVVDHLFGEFKWWDAVVSDRKGNSWGWVLEERGECREKQRLGKRHGISAPVLLARVGFSDAALLVLAMRIRRGQGIAKF